MSKNLKNIPKQVKMTEEQEQTFTNGINKGRKQERERIIKLAQEWISELRGHDGECNCKHEASVLQTFIDHPDFKGENK